MPPAMKLKEHIAHGPLLQLAIELTSPEKSAKLAREVCATQIGMGGDKAAD